jgi:hypothetical protein
LVTKGGAEFEVNPLPLDTNLVAHVPLAKINSYKMEFFLIINSVEYERVG